MQPHYLQHVPFEGLGSIENWAGIASHTITYTRLYANAPQPSIDTFDWLIVMGGQMGVHDDAAVLWLAAEKRLIERAIPAGRTVLGICLGAQLIADVLGARVYRNPQAAQNSRRPRTSNRPTLCWRMPTGSSGLTT